MKRLLMLAMLLMLALGGAQSALAAPFAFGPAPFDTADDLKSNLLKLVTGETIVQRENIAPGDFGVQYMLLVAVSDAALNKNFVVSDAANNAITSAATIAQDWGTGALGDLSGYSVSWDGLNNPISLNTYLNAVYTFGDSFVYQPAGELGIDIPNDTYFFGFAIPGSGNTVDFVIAFGTEPFSPVPVPAAAWLMGSGVAGLLALRKRVK